MKLIKTASGKQLKISKEEWTSIGEQAGWSTIKTAQSDESKEFMDGLAADNSAKLKPVIQLMRSHEGWAGSLVPKSEFDRKKLDQIIGRHEFNVLPQTVMSLYKQLWDGTSDFKTDQNSGYSLLIDGKGAQIYVANEAEQKKIEDAKNTQKDSNPLK